MKLKNIPFRVLLLTEKKFADINKGLIRDYTVVNNWSKRPTPKLSKTEKSELANAFNYDDFTEILNSPSKTPTNISYQVTMNYIIGI